MRKSLFQVGCSQRQLKQWLELTRLKKSQQRDESYRRRNVFGVYYKQAAEAHAKSVKKQETKVVQESSDDGSSVSSETRIKQAFERTSARKRKSPSIGKTMKE